MARIKAPKSSKVLQQQPDPAALEAEVAAVEPPPPLGPKPPRIYSRAETQEQIQLVLDWRIDSFGKREIWRQLKRKWPKLGMSRLNVLWERVDRIFQDRSDEPLLAKKEAALARLRRDAAIARAGERVEVPGSSPTRWEWRHKPDLKAALAIERLIAEIDGTMAPLKIEQTNVQLTAAMVQVVGRLTTDDAAEYLQEALDQQRLAEIARRELPALTVRPDGDGSRRDPSVVEAEAEE